MDIPPVTICQILGYSRSLSTSSSATPAMFLWYISSPRLEWKDFDSKILSHLMRCGKNHYHHQPDKQKKNKNRNHSVLGKLGLENISCNKKALKASLSLVNLTVDTATTLLLVTAPVPCGQGRSLFWWPLSRYPASFRKGMPKHNLHQTCSCRPPTLFALP